MFKGLNLPGSTEIPRRGRKGPIAIGFATKPG